MLFIDVLVKAQLVLNCLAAGLQTLKGFGKVCQQLHYLCESAVQSPERQYSMRSILWGVHLLGHAVKEVPTFVKSMPQPTAIRRHEENSSHAACSKHPFGKVLLG